MQHQLYIWTDKRQSVLSAWQEQLACVAHNPKLMHRLLSREPELLPRFAEHYRMLRALPRRIRRAMQRKWKKSLAVLALLLALGVAPAHGETITVTSISPHINADGQCSLIEAIVNANDDAQTLTDCAAGSGADTIVLPPGSTQTLTSYDNSTYGPTGLPVITSKITIEGNGSTINRDSEAAVFRILAVDRNGDLTLQQTTVSGGFSPTRSGGGVFNYGTLTLTNSTISDNYAAPAGGGVYNTGTVTLNGSTISGNEATNDGGGVDNLGGTVTVTNSTISGNSAFFGGGVESQPYGTLTVTNSTISGNSAIFAGGVESFGTLTVTNSTVSGNDAYYRAGGIYNALGGTATVTNSTISGNSAGYLGGGISSSFDGATTVTNSTISGNSASVGGGAVVSYDGTLILSRTLVSGNTASSGPEIALFDPPYGDPGIITADNYNLFGYSGNSGVEGFKPGATDIVPNEPLSSILDPTLEDNGGPTQTHALVPGSPAIDSSPDDEDCQPTDQREVARPQGETCDVGAFEFEADVVVPLCAGLVPTIIGTHGPDVITGTDGPDVIHGLGENDIIRGLDGDDVICGGRGRDNIRGGDGNDHLLGQRNNDILDGGNGDDSCNGGDDVSGDTAEQCEIVKNVP